jgi:hypothetical protein
MARRYFGNEGDVQPERDQRCLACHVTSGTPHSVALVEGVGCESCHGRSDTWRNEHYLPAWKQTRLADGFRDLRKPSARARSCVGCHVGAPGQEVNHDLIAAGHPPLRFELGAFHEKLPKHWDFDRERADDPQLEARLWLAGQIESSRAALDLLEYRANRSNGSWPELAEFDCESCHHPLTTPSWRQAAIPSSPLIRPGSPLWGTWHFSPRMLDAMQAANPEQADIRPPVDALRDRLANLAVTRADILANVKALHLQWPPSDSVDKSDVRWSDALQRLNEQATHAADRNWSSAAQAWLARMALNPPQEENRIETMRAIRSQLNVPAEFDPATIERR